MTQECLTLQNLDVIRTLWTFLLLDIISYTILNNKFSVLFHAKTKKKSMHDRMFKKSLKLDKIHPSPQPCPTPALTLPSSPLQGEAEGQRLRPALLAPRHQPRHVLRLGDTRLMQREPPARDTRVLAQEKGAIGGVSGETS